MNSILESVDAAEKELSDKQEESNMIYARQYEMEKDVTQLLNQVNREQESLSSLNETLTKTSSVIDQIDEQVFNLTEILKDRKPADIRETIEEIFLKEISLTEDQLEQSIRDIRGLVEHAQRSSQTADENEKIRDATIKLNRAKAIENELLTYVR